MKKPNTLKGIRCLLFFTISFLSSPPFLANAQQNQDIINQQDWITRNQQNILEETKRNKEIEAIKKERDLEKKEAEDQKQRKINVLEKTTQCFLIKKIQLDGANHISYSEQKKLTSPFINKCFEAKTLSNIVNIINNYYQNNGYITTQVLVPKQNLQSGVFELKIIEGKIKKISFNKNRLTDKMQKFMAFGNIEGDILNIKEINQGIYQINRLQSNAATLKIEPGNIDGESEVVIDNNKKFPARFTVTKDNLGNKFSGIQRTSLSSSLDNLLSLDDNINLSYTTNLHDNSQVRDIKSFTSGVSIPFKYNSFSYDYSRSEFKGQNPGKNGPTTLTGFSNQNKFSIDHVFLNKTSFRLSTNASITSKESASYLNGEKQIVSERKLSIMNVGFLISSYLNDTTNIYLKPSYSKGLKILNAQKDQKNLPANVAKSQFEVFKFYASLSKKLIIPKISTPITLSIEMDSQFAKETLFGSEQFSVGGYYSVRGFRENYISGDSGYYFRNKINFNLGSLASPLFTTSGSQKFSSYLNKFKLEPFYDYGYTKNKYDGSDGRLSGAGIKTIFESKYFNASLTYASALQKSKLITSLAKENKMVYFELSASY